MAVVASCDARGVEGAFTVYRVAVLLSAHDMNPLLSYMDRIVYLANGHAASGKTAEVVRADVLSRLYGHPIDVVHIRDRIVVMAQ